MSLHNERGSHASKAARVSSGVCDRARPSAPAGFQVSTQPNLPRQGVVGRPFQYAVSDNDVNGSMLCFVLQEPCLP